MVDGQPRLCVGTFGPRCLISLCCTCVLSNAVYDTHGHLELSLTCLDLRLPIHSDWQKSLLAMFKLHFWRSSSNVLQEWNE